MAGEKRELVVQREHYNPQIAWPYSHLGHGVALNIGSYYSLILISIQLDINIDREIDSSQMHITILCERSKSEKEVLHFLPHLCMAH